MYEEYQLNFGAHKGKTLHEVAKDFPSYVQWMAGICTKFSLTTKGKEYFAVICKEHPDDVQAAKNFLKDRCIQCCALVTSIETHFCEHMRAKPSYHYHPYGKRT